ncbi:porin PorA family protein [Actinomadura sp. K4S16]|uniref:porin PorA family protein n=1 Tax=Actinomadura sp. K4S16 TaxID=1316147 RepID=UPI0011F0960F|nr:porin PorA family protein [Actinomadura sp. K4S16]
MRAHDHGAGRAPRTGGGGMRPPRALGPAAVASGAFLLTLAPLLRLQVAPRIIVAPADVYQRTTLHAEDATYLDGRTGTVRRGARITAVNTLRGDVRASDGRTAVWDSFTWIGDADTGTEIDIQSQRVAFDRRTARLVNARGAAVDGDTRVRQSGIGPFWPIGVRKRTYHVFDTKTRTRRAMVFAGVERVQGVRVYKFVQRTEPTVVGPSPTRVPASLLDLDKPRPGFPGYDAERGDVAVDKVYEGTVTAWVDPRTGTRIDQRQESRTLLRTKDGVDRLVVADLVLRLSDADRRDRAIRADRTARTIVLLRVVLPLASAGLGAALLAAACFMARAARRPRPDAAPPLPREPAPEPGKHA